MLKINRITTKDSYYYEALFNNGNLYAFTINELVEQLNIIYGFKLPLFTNFNLN